MIYGSVQSIGQGWAMAVKEIYNNGMVGETEYGPKARFVNGMLLELVNPPAVWHKKDQFCTTQRIEEYCKQFERGFKGGFDYTYIDRLTNYPTTFDMVTSKDKFCFMMGTGAVEGFDQLAEITEELQRPRTDTKRLQAITWIPFDDFGSDHPPCLQRIWVYPYKGMRLDVHIHYRSWDMWKGFEANMVALVRLIKKEFIEPTDFFLGSVRCFGDNVHIYEDDWQAVEAVIEEL